MGIQDLYNLLRDECPHVFQTVPLSRYKGKKVAVDVAIYMNKACCTDKDKWLDIFLGHVWTLKENGIDAIYVFDGRRPDVKEKTAMKRKMTKMRMKEKMEQGKEFLGKEVWEKSDIKKIKTLFRPQDIKKIKAQSVDGETVPETVLREELQRKVTNWEKHTPSITPHHFRVARKCLGYLGQEVIIAEEEAESTCAYLCNNRVVRAVVTTDSDALAYGSHRVIKDIDSKNNTCVRLRIDHILDGLDISMNQLRDMCVLLGNDYNDRFKGYGKKAVWSWINEYESIEAIEENTPHLDWESLDYETSRKRFYVPKKFKYKKLNSKLDIDMAVNYMNKYKATSRAQSAPYMFGGKKYEAKRYSKPINNDIVEEEDELESQNFKGERRRYSRPTKKKDVVVEEEDEGYEIEE